MSKQAYTRRHFIQTSVIGATAMALPASSYGRILGANEKVNLAVVGLNSRGQAHITAASATPHAAITTFCDVDNRVFDKNQKLLSERGGEKAKTYSDIRKLLEDKNIDAITIATPDHWHTPMAILAMQAGKHVYLEKPCSHNPQEGEWLAAVQQQTGKVVQIGNQQRSAPTSIEAIQDIQEGIIGQVYYGKSWYSNTRGSIGLGKKAPIPEWLDWELWQGPAPRREYKDNWVHYNWHWFWNWGTGEINNNGLHEMDICRWALGVEFPVKVTSSGGRYHFQDDWEFYDTQTASFEFEGGKMLAWEGRSCNGFNHHERGRGATLHGTEGTILLDRNAYFAYDKGGRLIKQVNERSQSATTNVVGEGQLDVYHFENFIDGIRRGTKLHSPAQDIRKSTLLCHLGNIAQKTGRTLNINPQNGHILDDAEAMKLWGRAYEPGWEPKV
ncbi:MAG TPA: Gfo/Idh/MocA family oxidoreductase [Saprospiraceae bacterium]|nr:Gfo/Idh/MocA family oxidoreductase [Saprospiraceae bacterium]HMQ85884.1 Gfo/Idh/MocA family oxidoreductase [Saprospiraceae bacterium]